MTTRLFVAVSRVTCAARAKAANPRDSLIEGAASGAASSIDVVQPLRPVDADADRDIVLLNEFAPTIVDECAVGLEMIHQLEVPEYVADGREILSILLPAYDRGLARVPDDTKTGFE